MSFSVMLCTISIYIQSVIDNTGNGIKVLDGAETITIIPDLTPLPDSKILKAKNLPSWVIFEVTN